MAIATLLQAFRGFNGVWSMVNVSCGLRRFGWTSVDELLQASTELFDRVRREPAQGLKRCRR